MQVRLLSSPQFGYNEEMKLEEFKSLPVRKQGMKFLQFSPRLQKEVLAKFTDKEILSMTHYLDPDKTVDVLQLLPDKRQRNIVEELKEEMGEKVSMLLNFDAQTAGGLVSLDYVQVGLVERVGVVMEKMRKHEKKTGKFPMVLVVDEGKLMGTVANDRLMFARNNQLVGKLVKRVIKTRHNVGYKKVLELLRRNPHKKLVVLNDDESVLGVIYSDDVLRVLHEEQGKSLYDFAGVRREETVLDKIRTKVGFRYKWLIINLGTAFLAASVVGLFAETIEKYVLLAVYMPIVAGMGGNAGTQTLAVMVRGLALRQVSLTTAMPVILREVGTGLINGVINGVIVGLVSWKLNGEPLLGVIFGAAIVVTLMVSGFFGSLIPLIMQRLGKDPASSATIFITTATDVCGFFVFLGLASLFL